MSTKVTMQDIADALGFSRNTVSKAINNTGVISPTTKELILKLRPAGLQNQIPVIKK